MAKKAAKKAAKKSASKPKTSRKKDGFRPIGESLEQTADEIQAQARDAFRPDVQRGDSVDVVNGRWKTTTKDQLKRIANQYVSASKSTKTASGVKAEILNKAEENKNLDKWCFKKAVEWMLLGDEVLVRRLPLFLKYLDDLGVSDRSTAQADLLDAAQQPETNPDDEPEVADEAQGDIEQVLSEEAQRDQAAAAATGLAPSRRPQMVIVPRDDESGNSAAAG